MTLKYTLVKYTDNNVRENKCVYAVHPRLLSKLFKTLINSKTNIIGIMCPNRINITIFVK